MLSRASSSLISAGMYCLSRPLKIPRSVLAVPSAGRRSFSQTAARLSYEDTIKNLLIHKDTKVLCQGLTGKTVRSASLFFGHC